MLTDQKAKRALWRYHRGIAFEVWTDQGTWFWFVVDPYRDSGAIGAAATEAEAVLDACSSIEEMSARRRASCAAVGATAENALSLFLKYDSISLVGWERSLANLERYLSCVDAATA